MTEPEITATILHPETRRALVAFAQKFFPGADVEDVVQEALLSACRSADGFEARSGVMTWLYRIVVNAGRMQRRARTRKRRGGQALHLSLDEALDPSAWPASLQHPERALLTKEALTLVARELASTQAIDSELVWRYALDDVSLETLAEESQLSHGAVKSRMFRVRRALSQVASSDPCAA